MKILSISLLSTLLFCSSITSQVTFDNVSQLLPTNLASDHCVGVIDMNGDGKDDIIRMDEGEEIYLAIQNAPGSAFTQVSLGDMNVPGTGSANAWGLAAADLDGNGINDLVSGGFYNGVYIFQANGTGSSFSDDIELFEEIYVQGISLFDIDNDGNLDIFICDDLDISQMLMNDGNGNFSEQSNGLVPESDVYSDNSGNYGSCFMDVDNNGHCDLYIAKCKQGSMDFNDPRRINLLFLNDGNGNWTSAGEASNLASGAQSWCTDFGDIDNDGDLDAFIGQHDVTSDFLINDGTGVFTEVTAAAGLEAQFPFLIIQSTWVDFDNDGYIDLIGMGSEGHAIAWNDGDGTFTVSDNNFSGFVTNSYALGDLNDDGFMDVYCTANGYGGVGNENIDDAMFFNNGNGNNYLKVHLTGVESNVSGVGARVSIQGPWGTQIRDVKAGESYGIQNSLTQHFGTGQVTQISQLTVTWPSGEIDNFYDVPVNQTFDILEGTGVSSLEDLALAYRVNAFPNPTQDILQVRIETSLSTVGLSLTIRDMKGALIHTESIQSKLSSIDVSSWAQGTYQYVLSGTEGRILNGEFIKE